MTLVNHRTDVPVTIDESLCIDGCTLCVEICPLDALPSTPTPAKPSCTSTNVGTAARARRAARPAPSR
jgi:formate hydrogenlyase subunit 6/NADH:ubiquinone oxidoreductase subunit I